MNNPEVTILLPSFNTAELTKLCLRALRKYTDTSRIKVLVVDNGSRDESVAYLRTLKWITLVERPARDGECGGEQHSRSLDMLLEMVDTPYVLSIHTDTIIRRGDWLDFLLAQIKRDDRVAGVGSWKLAYTSPLKRCCKKLEDLIRFNIVFPLTRRKYNADEHFHYLRSHCALYRTELLRNCTKGFFDGMTAGKSIHKHLTDANYSMSFVDENELNKYINHLDHATVILNPQLFKGRKSSKPRARRKLGEILNVPEFDAIMADDALDA